MVSEVARPVRVRQMRLRPCIPRGENQTSYSVSPNLTDWIFGSRAPPRVGAAMVMKLSPNSVDCPSDGMSRMTAYAPVAGR